MTSTPEATVRTAGSAARETPLRRARAWRAARYLGFAFVAAVALEGVVRLFGLSDFPTYERMPGVQYVLAPDQSGSFMNRNAWATNERGMPTARRWSMRGDHNLLVIGNSIVAGGNPYDQTEKVAFLLERQVQGRFEVWPVAAGGWSTVNEIAYLERFPDVPRAADFFVWSHVQGGLEAPNVWLGENVYPTRRPRLASLYAVDRYVLPRFASLIGAHARDGWVFDAHAVPQEERGSYADHLARFDAAIGTLSDAAARRVPGILLLYPTVEQLERARRGEEWLPERADLQRVADRHGVTVLDLARVPEWKPALYRDSIHPTVEGNLALTRLLKSAIDRASEP